MCFSWIACQDLESNDLILNTCFAHNKTGLGHITVHRSHLKHPGTSYWEFQMKYTSFICLDIVIRGQKISLTNADFPTPPEPRTTSLYSRMVQVLSHRLNTYKKKKESVTLSCIWHKFGLSFLSSISTEYSVFILLH